MFPPKIDYLKQQEIIERNLPRAKSLSARAIPSNFRRRKWKVNKLVPQPAPKIEPVARRDYLTEMRVLREKRNKSLSVDYEPSSDLGLRNRAKKFSNTNVGIMKTKDDMPKSIISSIKAKIALIDKFNS